MGNVPPSASVRSKSLPSTRAASDTSSKRDRGRQSLPTSNIMQIAKKRIQGIAQSKSNSPKFFSSPSTDRQSHQSSQSESASEPSLFHPRTRETSSLQASCGSLEGRPFHNYQTAKYSLPCDEEEQDRMMALVSTSCPIEIQWHDKMVF
jgi:hypothetical protein